MSRHLHQVNAVPDEDIWEQIAARQSRLNSRLRLRYYGTRAAIGITVFVVAALACWQWSRQPQSGQPLPDHNIESPEKQQINPGSAPPVANVVPMAVPAINMPTTLVSGARAVAVNHSFGYRINSVPANAVRFRAETGINYENVITGTRVHIPALALRNPSGQVVRGEVELQLREYRSIPEFLASGIPMHYADERGSFFFNSGGMFELRVNQAGEELRMAPDQTCNVVFSPTTQLNDASLYYYDEKTGAWQYQSNAAFAGKNRLSKEPVLAGRDESNKPTVVSEAVVLRNNRKGDSEDCMPDFPELIIKGDDEASVIRSGIKTGYALASGVLKMPAWFRKNPQLNREQLLNGLERGLIRIVRHRDNAEFFFPEDVNNVYTELKAFKGCYFVRSADTAAACNGLHVIKPAGTPVFDPNEYWQRISVYTEGSLCHFTLYGEQGMSEFYAKLNASTGNDKFNAEKVMAEYERLREERQNNMDVLITSLRRFLLTAPIFQSKAEWCQSDLEWLDYFEKNHPMMAKRYAALMDAGLSDKDSLALGVWNAWIVRLRKLRFDRVEAVIENQQNPPNQQNPQRPQYQKNALEFALEVTRFGVYNCDQIYRLGDGSEPNYVYSAYQTPDGQRVVPAAVSILEHRSRMFFTLPEASRLLYLRGRPIDVLLTDRAGRTYHISAEKYARHDLAANQRSTTFVVDDVTDKTRTPREWAELLEL